MSIAGFILSLVAGFFMLIGLIPFLGIINWFTTLPAAILGAIFSGIGVSKSRSGLGVAGLAISIAVFFIAIVRLIIGGGIF
jgi:hypothetical protein